jgi:hypothetical protein
MIRARFSQRPATAAVLALLIVCLAPAVSWAQTMVFRNGCHYAVIVQAATVVRGRVYRHKPHVLRCGDVSPRMNMIGDMVINVYDGRMPSRVLFQGALRSSPTPMSFTIEPVKGARSPPYVRVKYRKSASGGMGAGMGRPDR